MGAAAPGVLRAAARPRRREAPRAPPQRLHDRGDRRGLLRGPPDGDPARAQRPVPGLLEVPRAQGDCGRSPATSRRPRRGRARSARSAARGRSSPSAAGSGRSSAARAIRTATTSRRKVRRRPIRWPSRSSAPRTTTATSSRVARGGPATSSTVLQLPQVRLHDELRTPRRAARYRRRPAGPQGRGRDLSEVRLDERGATRRRGPRRALSGRSAGPAALARPARGAGAAGGRAPGRGRAGGRTARAGGRTRRTTESAPEA